MSKKFCDFLINILLVKNCQLGFSSKIKVPQLGLARFGTFIARLGSSFQGRDTKLERFLAKNQLYSNEITKF